MEKKVKYIKNYLKYVYKNKMKINSDLFSSDQDQRTKEVIPWINLCKIICSVLSAHKILNMYRRIKFRYKFPTPLPLRLKRGKKLTRENLLSRQNKTILRQKDSGEVIRTEKFDRIVSSDFCYLLSIKSPIILFIQLIIHSWTQ